MGHAASKSRPWIAFAWILHVILSRPRKRVGPHELPKPRSRNADFAGVVPSGFGVPRGSAVKGDPLSVHREGGRVIERVGRRRSQNNWSCPTGGTAPCRVKIDGMRPARCRVDHRVTACGNGRNAFGIHFAPAGLHDFCAGQVRRYAESAVSLASKSRRRDDHPSAIDARRADLVHLGLSREDRRGLEIFSGFASALAAMRNTV